LKEKEEGEEEEEEKELPLSAPPYDSELLVYFVSSSESYFLYSILSCFS
jgi:hypothetical protein